MIYCFGIYLFIYLKYWMIVVVFTEVSFAICFVQAVVYNTAIGNVYNDWNDAGSIQWSPSLSGFYCISCFAVVTKSLCEQCLKLSHW